MDAFAGLIKNRHRLDDPSAALSYVRMSVINGARNRWRRRPQEASAALRFWSRERTVADPADDEVADRDRVARALDRLPRRQREVVVLRYYADLPEAEIAALLAVTAGTVKSQLFKARARLADELGAAPEGIR
jgi:RNA polymerase sigma factor (sigma-70 family)